MKARPLALHRAGRRLRLLSTRGISSTCRIPAPHSDTAQRRDKDTELVLSVLSSTATRRDAKSYLAKFTPQEDGQRKARLSKAPPGHRYYDPARVRRAGVNLGGLYAPTRAADSNPVFSHDLQHLSPALAEPEPLHVALVKLRDPERLNDVTLADIGHTLSQLSALGLRSVLVVDCDVRAVGDARSPKELRHFVLSQADRVVAGIAASRGVAVQRLDQVLGVTSGHSLAHQKDSEISVTSREQLLAPLRRGIISVLPSVGYTTDSQRAILVDADDVVYALTRELAGLSKAHHDESPMDVAARVRSQQKLVSLDKLILLDPVGGLASSGRPHDSHVFVNLEQEFEEVRAELMSETTSSGSSEEQASMLPPSTLAHLRNLNLLRRTLSLLPPSASGLLISPEEAAHSGQSREESTVSAVGTRRQKNPLIHNLLTDKPAFSSSLPTSRRANGVAGDKAPALSSTPSTLVKKGMSLTILPEPTKTGWIAPPPGQAALRLDDPRIDLPRLIHLIEDSFGRKLDVPHYLSRVNERLAGIIIAGEYEGAALLTWESPESAGNTNAPYRLVPYLDKFAVLKRSQGAGGVADILFKAMVRTCFPDGVCWRSRRNNPVNKWYFERARGTWRMQDSNWTMFWTTPETTSDAKLFRDYESVCRSVESSWSDRKGHRPQSTALVALGSNMGDRVGWIEQACREMDERGLRVLRTSSLWETEAMYVVDQAPFVNGVCEVWQRDYWM